MRRLLASLLLLLTWVLVTLPAGAASRDLGFFGDGTLITDGRDYVAVTARGSVQVLDVRSGERQRIDVPPPCWGTGLSAAKLVVSCRVPQIGPPYVSATGYTIDLRTGARVDLPSLTVAAFESRPGPGSNDETYRAVGRRWAEVVEAGYHFSRPRFLDLATGTLSYGPGDDLGLVADLDAASGVRRLCSPLRRPLVPDPAFQFGLVPGVPLQAGPYTAGVYHREDGRHRERARIELGRCGSPAKVIQRCSAFCVEATLDRRTLAWVETRGSALYPYRIAIHSLRTGKTRRITRRLSMQLRLVRGELYVLMNGRLRGITP